MHKKNALCTLSCFSYSISCGSFQYVLVQLKMILLCHVQARAQLQCYIWVRLKSSRTNEKIVTNSDVHKYFPYVPVCCRINEREENLMIIQSLEYFRTQYWYGIVFNVHIRWYIIECGLFYFSFATEEKFSHRIVSIVVDFYKYTKQNIWFSLYKHFIVNFQYVP